jgi:hypothetical protein
MNYCCDGLRVRLSCAGERGLALIACETSSGHIRFVFQSRGLAFGDEEKWKPIPIDVKINVSAETGLQFCPWCGQDLGELVEKSPEFFRALAAEHRKYLTGMPGLS